MSLTVMNFVTTASTNTHTDAITHIQTRIQVR